MGKRNWKHYARYLQNTANTVFKQAGIDLSGEADRAWEPDYPKDLWKRVMLEICAHIMVTNFGDEAMGRILGAGHPDNTDSDDWLLVGDIMPLIHVGKNDTLFVRLVAATLVAAKINSMRGLQPWRD